MKLCFAIFLATFTLSTFAQEKTPEKDKPIDNAREEQQALEEKNLNEFEVGPYDREGKYINYNRLDEEKKATRESKKSED